jgi:hypothetical protein
MTQNPFMNAEDLHGFEQLASRWCHDDDGVKAKLAQCILTAISLARFLDHQLNDPNYMYSGRIHRQAIITRDMEIEALRAKIKKLESGGKT